MRPHRFLHYLLVFALVACDGTGHPEAGRHLERLCDQEQLREEYLDFYWDDLRTRQPELWVQALATCTARCPAAVNCAAVRSVASWYGELASPFPIVIEP
ncbi:MAG: hypothetical protein GY719_23300 [bacterium]|nr:hypothetical protein [bacterium]